MEQLQARYFSFLNIVLNRIQRQYIIKPLLEANISTSQVIDWYCFKYQLRDIFTSTSRINSPITNGIDGITLHYDWKLQSVINRFCLTKSELSNERGIWF